MSRIDELKKQNPDLVFNIIDALNEALPKTKYVELMLNLIKNDEHLNSSKVELENILRSEFGFDVSKLENKHSFELLSYYRFFSDFINKSRFDVIKNFISYNEKNLVINNDLTTYESFEDIEKQVSLCEIKLIDKELEKQIIKLHESDEWLILKPMSWIASKKYGANTKWCTTMDYESDHFYRYAKNGVLIYCLNKLTGDKFAVYKSLEDYSTELSFWDIKDNRVDSMQLDIPDNIFLIIRDQIKNSNITNWNLLSDEEKFKQTEYTGELKNSQNAGRRRRGGERHGGRIIELPVEYETNTTEFTFTLDTAEFDNNV